MARKKLSNKEKKRNAELKRELQKEGYLPPDKPKLNRQKFVEEAEAEWKDRDDAGSFVWEVYLMQAISYMLGHTEKNMRLSREAVGVAKILKIAMRLRKFSEKLKAKGENEYRVIDQYNYIKDILDA